MVEPQLRPTLGNSPRKRVLIPQRHGRLGRDQKRAGAAAWTHLWDGHVALDASAGGGSFPRRGASGAADGGSGGGGWRCGVRIPASVAWCLFKSHGLTLKVSQKTYRAINESYDCCGQRCERGEETGKHAAAGGGGGGRMRGQDAKKGGRGWGRGEAGSWEASRRDFTSRLTSVL